MVPGVCVFPGSVTTSTVCPALEKNNLTKETMEYDPLWRKIILPCTKASLFKGMNWERVAGSRVAPMLADNLLVWLG